MRGLEFFIFYFYGFFLSTLALRSAATNWFVILSFMFPETRGNTWHVVYIYMSVKKTKLFPKQALGAFCVQTDKL